MNNIFNLVCGNSLEVLKTYPANHFDSVVCDPPYELGFMGKKWDSTGIAFNVELWKEVLRVLKPGAHLIAFSGSRTYHRMAVAIEDAGFEIRDQIMWVYGSGFPKSLDVSKAIEGKLTIGSSNTKDQKKLNGELLDKGDWGIAKLSETQGYRDTNYDNNGQRLGKLEPTTDQAKQWDGWGTALKPSHEPMVLARKPLSEKTVAENVLKWGVGGLNIKECRIDSNEKLGRNNKKDAKDTDTVGEWGMKAIDTSDRTDGRWPANFIHNGQIEEEWNRFFYCAKASKKDRNDGLELFTLKEIYPQNNSTDRKEINKNKDNRVANNHPTVKPTDLMAYLCKLITPYNGLILDPFNGSGSTGKGAVRNGFRYVGIDLSQDYIDISKARIEYELNKPKKKAA